MTDIKDMIINKCLEVLKRKDVKEDIKIKDPTGRKHDEAKKYIDVYKDSFRPTPRIKNKKFGEFTLSGPDEKFVADMVNKQGRFKEDKNE